MHSSWETKQFLHMLLCPMKYAKASLITAFFHIFDNFMQMWTLYNCVIDFSITLQYSHYKFLLPVLSSCYLIGVFFCEVLN